MKFAKDSVRFVILEEGSETHLVILKDDCQGNLHIESLSMSSQGVIMDGKYVALRG